MLFSDSIGVALRGVSSNASRSLLTMLGIIIGVCAVVLMTGVGKSMEGVILGQISVLGPQSMVIFPGNQGPEGGPSSLRPDFDALQLSDVEALKSLTTVKSITPQIFVGGDISYGNETSSSQVIGTPPTYFDVQTVTVSQGRLLDETDERASRSVVIIGSDTAEDLFFNENPLGKRIRIDSRSFTVVGVMDPLGTQFFQNFDERIIMPFSTARSITNRSYVDVIMMVATDQFDIAFADVRYLLRQRHGIQTDASPTEASDDDDFLVRSSAQAQEILGSVSLGLTLFITMVAGISLIVGGIGIMNIMLVAVTERTREIGLRKALGATKRDILQQFLIESVLLTIIGSFIGSVIGIFFAFIVATITQGLLASYTFALSPPAILFAFVMAAGTGLVFGIYPARQASLLEPIEALRYE